MFDKWANDLKTEKANVRSGGTKMRGIFSKKEVPRQSAQAALTAISGAMLAAGASRFKEVSKEAERFVDGAERLVAAGPTPEQAGRALVGAGFAKTTLGRAKVALDAYPASSTTVANDLRTLRKFTGAQVVAKHLDANAKGLGFHAKTAETRLAEADKPLLALRNAANPGKKA